MQKTDIQPPAIRLRIPEKLRFETLAKCCFKCHYCGIPAMETPLVVDHVLPVAAGGETVADNLVAACKPCNVGKSSRLVDAPPVPPALSLKGVRLGRHALGFKLVHVRLSHDTVARIDALAGSYGRAGFIRKAIEEALDRMEREQKG